MHKLPIVDQPASSLRSDGRRNYIHPADVRGRFTRSRNWVIALLIAIYLTLPWIEIAGHPAVFLDIAHRRFFLFGLSFNAQDTWLLFFLVSGAGFALFALTTVFGRVWCGYACPQTVFLEGVFRRIERWVEGSRSQRLRRNSGPWNLDKIARKAIKHTLFFALAALIAHVFISYFVSMPSLLDMVSSSPSRHWTAFLWTGALTLVMYFDFAWFREQMCLIVCPYGRLQSVMTDADTLIIGYDETRGEPRGKKRDSGAGDCVDCRRCVQVCPTGIDIRNGLQIDCIGCAACVDACDDIMVKLERKPGLIRYDSLRGLQGEKRRFWRPRLALYAVLGVLGLAVATFGFRSHASFEANLLRLPGRPYQLEQDGRVRNAFELHLVNKRTEARDFALSSAGPELDATIAMPSVHLAGGQDLRIPIFVYAGGPASQNTRALPSHFRLRVQSNDGTERMLKVPFLHPK